MWNQPFDPDLFAQRSFRPLRHGGRHHDREGRLGLAATHTHLSMNDHGRAAVVLDTGAVTRGSGSKNEDKERNIRKWFVDHDLVDGVILLPDNLFYNTTAAGVIVVLSQAASLPSERARSSCSMLRGASKRDDRRTTSLTRTSSRSHRHTLPPTRLRASSLSLRLRRSRGPTTTSAPAGGSPPFRCERRRSLGWFSSSFRPYSTWSSSCRASFARRLIS